MSASHALSTSLEISSSIKLSMLLLESSKLLAVPGIVSSPAASLATFVVKREISICFKLDFAPLDTSLQRLQCPIEKDVQSVNT